MDMVSYKIREVLDKNKIEAFLRKARIGHLGMVGRKNVQVERKRASERIGECI